MKIRMIMFCFELYLNQYYFTPLQPSLHESKPENIQLAPNIRNVTRTKAVDGAIFLSRSRPFYLRSSAPSQLVTTLQFIILLTFYLAKMPALTNSILTGLLQSFLFYPCHCCCTAVIVPYKWRLCHRLFVIGAPFRWISVRDLRTKVFHIIWTTREGWCTASNSQLRTVAIKFSVSMSGVAGGALLAGG